MMSPRHLLAGRSSGSRAVDAALLVLRVFAGVAFVLHGWGKVANVSGFAAAQGVPVVLGAAAAYVGVWEQWNRKPAYRKFSGVCAWNPELSRSSLAAC